MTHLITSHSQSSLSPKLALNLSTSINNFDLLSPKYSVKDLRNPKTIEEAAVRKVNQESFIEKKKDQSILEKRSNLSISKQNSSRMLNSSKINTSISKDQVSIPNTLKFASAEFNHKGFGNGFVSGSQRFFEEIYPNTGPGPGAYIPLTAVQEPTVLSNGRPRKIKKPKLIPIYKGDVVPGPGEYKIKENLVKKTSPSYKSVFQSSTTRSVIPKKEGPSPDVYDVIGNLIHKTFNKQNPETSSFHQPLNLVKPAHHNQPLVSHIYHKTQADAYSMYPDISDMPTTIQTEPSLMTSFELKSTFRSDRIKPISINTQYMKSSKMHLESPNENSLKKKQKDPFFAGEFHLPRIHSLEPI